MVFLTIIVTELKNSQRRLLLRDFERSWKELGPLKQIQPLKPNIGIFLSNLWS